MGRKEQVKRLHAGIGDSVRSPVLYSFIEENRGQGRLQFQHKLGTEHQGGSSGPRARQETTQQGLDARPYQALLRWLL